jgi:hypothetical protein
MSVCPPSRRCHGARHRERSFTAGTWRSARFGRESGLRTVRAGRAAWGKGVTGSTNSRAACRRVPDAIRVV